MPPTINTPIGVRAALLYSAHTFPPRIRRTSSQHTTTHAHTYATPARNAQVLTMRCWQRRRTRVRRAHAFNITAFFMALLAGARALLALSTRAINPTDYINKYSISLLENDARNALAQPTRRTTTALPTDG